MPKFITAKQCLQLKKLSLLRSYIQRKFIVTKAQAGYIIRLVAMRQWGKQYKPKVLDNVAFIRDKIRLHQVVLKQAIDNHLLSWNYSDNDVVIIPRGKVKMVAAAVFMSPQLLKQETHINEN